MSLGLGILGVTLFAWPPVAWIASRSLEGSYAVESQPAKNVQVEAIVVLAGYVQQPTARQRRAVVGYDTYIRCLHAADLYHDWNPLPVLACGGNGFSTAMREVLLKQGVPGDMIWIEDRSTRTYENARYAAEILRDKGIGSVVLVTDAYHMTRSELCFRNQNIEVVPSPSTYRTDTIPKFLPNGSAIRQNELTLHEWFGILWYWLQGWI